MVTQPDAKVLVHADVAKVEVVQYGSVVYSVAKGYYSYGTTADVSLDYNNNWGYTEYSSDFYVSSKQMPTKPCDPYPPLYPFNTIRCIDKVPYGIEYKFAVDSGSYYIYVGTRSHWHGRKVIPFVNGEAQTQFNLDPVNRVTQFKNVSDVSGQLTVQVKGLASQDEGSIAFIAIQPVNDTTVESAIPSTPSIEGNLNLGDTQFSVGNVKANTKIQVSLAETPYSVIYEGLATTDGNHEITLKEEALIAQF